MEVVGHNKKSVVVWHALQLTTNVELKMLPGLARPVQGLHGGWGPGLAAEKAGSAVSDQGLNVSVNPWPPYQVPASLFEPDYAQVALMRHSKDTHPKETWDHSAEPSCNTGVIPACKLFADPEVGQKIVRHVVMASPS